VAERGEPGYDVYVAYSHAADRTLADLVVRGLQTFAKPWHRRRTFRVFRDATALAASPSLWSALEQALLSSRYLVVLLSPQAAASQWIDREVAAFLRQNDTDRILLVLTGGELVWDTDARRFDPHRSTALPSQLHGVFDEEPMWLDLRWAATETNLTLRDPRLQDSVASLVAVVAGVRKDELLGEDVRQFRRTQRLARLIAGVLSALLMYSIGVTLVVVSGTRGIGPRAWTLILAGVVVVSAGAAIAVRVPFSRLIGRLSQLAVVRTWRREIDLYIGPATVADRDIALEVAAAVRRLGQSRRRWLRQPRVVVETRLADQVEDLESSQRVARRARHYLHVGRPETADAPAPNFILQDWLTVHPAERLLLGTVGSGPATAASIPAMVRSAGLDLSARTFDLRSGFATLRPGPWSGSARRDVPEPARLIGLLLGVDPYLVLHGGSAVLQAARRRSRIEEPLERWNLAETVRFVAQARTSVHLPEMQSALAALGQSPFAYFGDLLVDQDDLIAKELAPRAAAMLAQAERNATRETWLRIGRPRPRGALAMLAVPAGVAATLLGLFGVTGSILSSQATLLLPTAVLAGLGAVALAAAVVAGRRSAEFELRRQKTFMSTYAEAVAAAAESLEESLPEAVILPYLRQRLNDELGSAGTVTIPYDATLLTSQTLDRFRLETAALRRSAARVEAPGGGAIGLAGPRGAGKTTLLSSLTRTRLFHRPESPDSQVGVLVAAPVHYETPEFVTQVLAAVCRETIRAGSRGQRLAPHGYLVAAVSPVRRSLAAVVLVAALAAIPFAAGWVTIDQREWILILLVTTAVGSAAVLLDALGAARRIRRRTRYTVGPVTGNAIARSSAERIRDLTAAAGTILNRLYYREERALTAAVKLAVPLGIEANSSGKYEGRPWTTAEIIQQFRQFAGALNDCGYRVVIAIDELDKVDDDQEVIRLLNDLKALFGLNDCYFLVAVSISATSSASQADAGAVNPVPVAPYPASVGGSPSRCATPAARDRSYSALERVEEDVPGDVQQPGRRQVAGGQVGVDRADPPPVRAHDRVVPGRTVDAEHLVRVLAVEVA
jgi:MTH538 TIR-like domain (DUF1863)